MADNKIKLTKSDRLHVWWRSTFIQGSWNYERMQNGGWTYAMIPAIKKLYTSKEDRAAALKRQLLGLPWLLKKKDQMELPLMM